MKNSFNFYKGIATFIIVFAHIKTIISPLTNMGYIALSIFFCISGSLLVEKFITEKNYEKGFMNKKIKRLYIPYVLSNIFFILTSIIFSNYKINILNIVKDIIGINTVNGFTWYVSSILLAYLIFYVLFIIEKKHKIIKNEFIKYLLLTITTYLLFIIIKITVGNKGPIIFNDLSLGLFMGMLFGLLKHQGIIKFKNNYIKYLLIISAVILHLFTNSDNYLLVSQLLMPIFISLIVHYNIMDKFESKIIKKLSYYSLEIYLLHIPIMNMYRNDIIYINENIVYIILYLITLAASCYTFKKINKCILNLKIFRDKRLSGDNKALHLKEKVV